MLGTLLVPFNCFFVPFLKCEDNCKPDIFIDSLYASVFCLLFIIVSIMTIFKFKNRTHQIYWLNVNLISIPFLFLILYIFHCFVSKDNISLNVSTLAKWKTTVQLMSCSSYLIWRSDEYFFKSEIIEYICILLLWLAALITIITCFDYLKKVWNYL